MSPHTHASQNKNERSFEGQKYWGFKYHNHERLDPLMDI